MSNALRIQYYGFDGVTGRFLAGATGFVLAIALLLTTATQLRPTSSPVGVGELMLAAWILWQFAIVSLNPPHPDGNGIAGYLAFFWFAFFVVMTVALAFSYQNGYWDESGAIHDAVALGFSAIFSILLALSLVNRRRIESLVWNLIWICSVIMALLLVLAARRGTFLGIDPWYAVIRFTGWAKNPNQIGLLLVSLPFLAMWLGKHSAMQNRTRLVATVSVLLVAGLLCQSDALYLGWVSGGLIIVFFVWTDLLTRKGVSGTSAFLSVVGVPGLLLLAVLWFAATIFGEFKDTAVQMYELGGQGSVRLQIWSHGVSAFVDSPLVGHGPGAFAGVRAPFSGFEAHNTFIDIATKAGLLGLFLYTAVIATLHVQLLRTNQYHLLAALASITVFSVFHYVLRQPVYWTIVVICMRMAWDAEVVAEMRRKRFAPNFQVRSDNQSTSGTA